MKTAKRIGAVALAAAMLAGCGGSSSGDTSTFRFASELDIMGMDSTVG